MELLATRDPEDAREIPDPVLDRLMDAVDHHAGTVNESTCRCGLRYCAGVEGCQPSVMLTRIPSAVPRAGPSCATALTDPSARRSSSRSLRALPPPIAEGQRGQNGASCARRAMAVRAPFSTSGGVRGCLVGARIEVRLKSSWACSSGRWERGRRMGVADPLSLDHLPRPRQQGRRHRQAERLRGLQINHKLVLARRLHRKGGRLAPRRILST
jgi:hypothetical protein